MAKGATATALKSKTKSSTNTFTHQQSIAVVRNLLRVSISEICFLRNIFPEEYFIDREYASMNVKQLIQNKDDMNIDDDDDGLTQCDMSQLKSVKQITQWLENGAFEALEKNCLQTIELCIYSIDEKKNPKELLESYQYKIKYPSESNDSSEPTLATTITTGSKKNSTATSSSTVDCSPAKARTQAIQLVRSLISMTNSLEPLPESRVLTMKLVFNDNVPEGEDSNENWIPSNFRESKVEFPESFTSESLKVELGKVTTGFHTLAMKLETAENEISPENNAASAESSEDTDGKKTSTDDDNNSHTTDEDDDEDAASDSDCSATQLATNAAAEMNISKKPCNNDSTPSLPAPTHTAVLEKLIQHPIITAKKLSQDPYFPQLSEKDAQSYLNQFLTEGVIKPVKSNTSLSSSLGYKVVAYDEAVYSAAIFESHGKNRRCLTAKILLENNAEIVSNEKIANSVILRMQHEKLLESGNKNSYLGSKVLYYNVNISSEHATKQAYVERWIRKAKKNQKSSAVTTTAATPETAKNKVPEKNKKKRKQVFGSPVVQTRRARTSRRVTLRERRIIA